jgi:uncharacterized protein YkwD
VVGLCLLLAVIVGLSRPSSPKTQPSLRPLSDRPPAAIAISGDTTTGQQVAGTEAPAPTPTSSGTPTATASPSPSDTPSHSAVPPTQSHTNKATSPADPRLALEAGVIAQTNAERAKNGCPAVHLDTRLRTAARGHSDDMAAKNYFSHYAPDGTGPGDRASAAGYSDWSGENIAYGYPSASAVMTAWMNSDGHRANILNCQSKAIGVGVHLGGKNGPYWTQMFGYS